TEASSADRTTQRPGDPDVAAGDCACARHSARAATESLIAESLIRDPTPRTAWFSRLIFHGAKREQDAIPPGAAIAPVPARRPRAAAAAREPACLGSVRGVIQLCYSYRRNCR